MATIDESDFTNKQVDVKDHFAALQRTMINVQKIDTETIASQLSSLSEVMGSSMEALAEGKLEDKDHLDLQKYLDKLGLMAEEGANVIKAFNAYTKEVANSKDEEEALGKVIDANQASMKKINALETEREELINKVNNHNSITEELSNKINNVLERREQYQETSNNLVQKYNDKIEQVEQKLKAENSSQQDIAKLQQEKINLETKIGDVKDRTNRFLDNSLSLHEDLKTKLEQQQQLYEDAPNKIESINSKLRQEIAFNDIIKKDLENFSEGMEKFGLMTDKSRKAVEKVLGIDKDINKELKTSIDNQDKLTGKIDKTHQNSKNVLQTLENSVERTELLISDTTDFANEMGRAADEAERLLAATLAMQVGGRRRRTAAAEPNPFSINDSGQAEMQTPGGYTTTVSKGFAAAATAGMTLQASAMNSGGYISGPAGIDVIPAMLTNGEYVVNASATKKFLPLLEKINSGQSQSFASGGVVGNNPWTTAAHIEVPKYLSDIEKHLKELLGLSKEDASNSQKDIVNQSLYEEMVRNILQSKDQLFGHQTNINNGPGKEKGRFVLRDEKTGNFDMPSFKSSYPTGRPQLKDHEFWAADKKHFLEGPGDIYKDLQQETIKVFMENLHNNGTDFSKVDEKTIKADIAKQIQINLKAFETLYKGIEKENKVTNKIQGYQLEQGEAAGASPERKSDLVDALKQQADSMEFLKNAGVIGDDFGQRVEDTKRDQLVNSVFLYGLRDELTTAIKEGLYNDVGDIRKMLAQYKSPAELTELAQLGKTDVRSTDWTGREKPAFLQALDNLEKNKNLTPDFAEVSANQERQKGKTPISLGTHITQQIEKLRVKEDATKPGKSKPPRARGGGMSGSGGIRPGDGDQEYLQHFNKSIDVISNARQKANNEIFEITGDAAKFGATSVADFNSHIQSFWDSSTEALNEGQQHLKKAMVAVAETGEAGIRKLEQLAMQTTQTFSLVGNDLPTNLLNVRDATIDTLTSLKDATKGGSLLDMDLDSEINKLEELQKDQHQNIDSVLSAMANLTSMSNSGVLNTMASENKTERSSAISNLYDMMANQLQGKQDKSRRLSKNVGIDKATTAVNSLSTGGFVSGPMGKDVIPAMLTDGEYVIRADVAKNWRGFLEHLNTNGHLGLHRGGPVMLADGGAPGGGSGGGGGGGGGGGSGPDLSAMLSQLSKNNAEVQGMSHIFSEIVESVKKANEEGKTAEQLQALINIKVSDMQKMLDSELEMQGDLLNVTTKRLGQLKAMKDLKLSGVHDAVLGAFTAVEDKIDGILSSIPFVGSALAMSIKASTGPAFDELREGASEAFLAMADEFLINGGDIDGAMVVGMDRFKESATKAGEHMEMVGSFAKKIGPGMIAAGAAALGFVALLGMALKRFFDLEAKSLEFRQELGLAASSTKHIESAAAEVNQEMAGYGVNLDQAYEAATALTKELGSTMLVTKDQIKMVAMMNAGLGISADSAVGVYETFKNLSGGSSEVAKNLSLTTVALSTAAGVPLDQVMGDIAGASETVYAMSQGTGVELAVAAIEARRLGTNIESISSSMESALDFESSISNEMKMASMLGRHISMDAMRQAAFAGDQVKYMEEQQKVMGEIGDLSEMNMHQRKSIAAAMGMEVGELMKMQTQTKALAALENGTVAQKEALAKYQKQRNAALNGETKSLEEQGMEILKQQNAENVKADIMAKINSLMTDLGEVLLPVIQAGFKILMPILDAIFFVLKGVVKVVDFILTPFTLIADVISAINDDSDALKARFDGIVPTLITISGVIAGIGALFLGMGPMIGKLFSGMVTGAKKAFGFMQKGAKGAFGMLTGKDGAPTGADVTDKIKGMFGGDKTKSGDLVPDVDPKKGDKFKKFLDAFNKIDMSKIVKAAAALLILSGALWVSAKAFQEFSKVSWDGVAKGIIGLTALVVAAKFLEKGSTSMIKGAAAIGILGLALLPAALAFQMFSDVSWGGVLAGMIALGALAVVAMVLGNLIVPIALGAAAIALLGIALIPFGVAAIFAGVGAMLIATAFTVMVSALQLLTFEDIAKIALLGATFVGLGVMIPFVILGAAALGIMGAALLAFSVSALFASVGITALAIGFAILSASIATMGENSIAVLLSLGMIGLLAPMFFIASAGILMLAGAIAVMSAALLGASIMSMFSSDDPFAMYINLGENADKLDKAANGLKNIAWSMSALSNVDAEDILGDIADGMEELFDEIEDIEIDAINKFVSIGTSFGLIGAGMNEIKTGIGPFKEMLTLISDPANYEAAIVGINSLTLALTDLCSVIQSLGESELGILEVSSAEGGGGEAPTTQEMAGGGAGAVPMTTVVQQVASVPATSGVAMNSAGGASSNGVETRLDELISLMKSGKIGVNLDGKKVESQLAKTAP